MPLVPTEEIRIWKMKPDGLQVHDSASGFSIRERDEGWEICLSDEEARWLLMRLQTAISEG